tara:strand:- start:855 stop:1625 length:771 start_codon:yes stop_codon:yes gene_type:complete
MQRSDTIGELAKALAAANLEITNPSLDAVNPHFKSRYASLGAIINAVRLPLARHGISAVQTVSTDGGAVGVTTTLLHASGEWMAETAMSALPDRATVQQLGSVITYLRRYALASITGIVGEDDDDGNASTSPSAPRTEARKPFKPQDPRTAVPPPPIAPKATKPVPEPVAEVKAMDAYPDVFEGTFDILRVVVRAGKPYAIQVDGKHGKAWIATTVQEYADLAKEHVNDCMQLQVERVGDSLQIMKVIASKVEVPF